MSKNNQEKYQQEAEQIREMMNNNEIAIRANNSATSEPVQNRVMFYILSLKWFNMWKEKIGYDANQNGFSVVEDSVQDKELPEINADLIDHKFLEKETENLILSVKDEHSIINNPMKTGQAENIDFMYVNKEIWEYFNSKYTGGWEIPRIGYLDGDFTRIDQQLAQVLFCFLKKLGQYSYTSCK